MAIFVSFAWIIYFTNQPIKEKYEPLKIRSWKRMLPEFMSIEMGGQQSSGHSGHHSDVKDVFKDSGDTFTTLVKYMANNPYLSNMSIQPDGLFYFGQLGYAICRLQSGFQIATYTMAPHYLSDYLLRKSLGFCIPTLGEYIIKKKR